jgi:hypothetical protein
VPQENVEPGGQPLPTIEVADASSGGPSVRWWSLVAVAVSVAAMLLVGVAVGQWIDGAPADRRGTGPDTRGGAPVNVAGPSAGPTASPSAIPSEATTPPPDLAGHVTESRPNTGGGKEADPPLAAGARIGLEPLGRQGFRVRHRDFVARVDAIGPASGQLDRADSSFTVRAGLADPRCFSFEAVNFPGFFLRHQNFDVRLHRFERSTLYVRDATFCAVPGLAGNGVSFRSVNFPDRFLGLRGDRLGLDPPGQGGAARLAMTFAVRAALLPAPRG